MKWRQGRSSRTHPIGDRSLAQCAQDFGDSALGAAGTGLGSAFAASALGDEDEGDAG